MLAETLPTDLLWRYALAAVPLVVIVAVVCRCVPCRPQTRYTLWLIALVAFVALPTLPAIDLPSIDLGFEPARRAGAGAIETPRPAPAPDFSVPRAGTLQRTPWFDGPPPDPEPPTRSGILQPMRDHAVVSRGETADAAPTGVATPATPHPRSPAERASAVLEIPPVFTGPRPARSTSAGGVAGERITRQPAGGDTRTAEEEEAAAGLVARTAGELSRWTVQLGAVRDAVMGLPSLPTTVWTGGILLLVALVTLRVGRARRIVWRAHPAPDDVVRMVADESRRLGLRRAPATLMVDLRVSPMVWCGRAPRLVLPRPLWAHLDDVGRRAVILHELAHLKRRDHWVCWIEMVVGCLYWWHPVVWWIRRRLREEQDLCCDAWVTALLPAARLEYARALLNTRAYLSDLRPVGPVVGLGVTSVRAKRFARRLTMVMTQPSDSRAAKLSLRGLALAATVAVGAYLVTPVLACPPTPKDPASKAKPATAPSKLRFAVPKADKVKPPRAPKAPRAARAPRAPAAPRASTRPGEDETTFEQFMNDRGRDRDRDSIEERIEHLERQLEKLYDRLERLLRQRQSMRYSGEMPVLAGPLPDLPEMPVLPDMPDMPDMPEMPAMPVLPDMPDMPDMPEFGSLDGAATIARQYKMMSCGKLNALSKLMKRKDVPVIVSAGNDAITVHATPDQHLVFESFCRMIDGQGREKVQEYRLPEGKLSALAKLMARSDVPILVEPKCKSIRVHGNDQQQAVFNAFCQMIHPEHGQSAANPIYADLNRTSQMALASAYQHQAMQEYTQRRNVESLLQALEGQMESLRYQADALRSQADALRDQADQLESQVEEAADEAEDADGRQRAAIRQQLNLIRVQARSLFRQGDQMDRKAERVERDAERVEQRIEELETRIEEIEQTMDR